METESNDDMYKDGNVNNCSNELKKISVIVPVFNSEKTIKRCVESVLNQTYSQFEIILIDDGSSDSSGCVCDKFAEENSCVIVIHQNNQGVSAARNAGIDAATGDYVLFLDSDDCIKPDMLQTYMEAVEDGFIDVVVGALELLNETGDVITRKKPPKTGYYGSDIWNQICINSEIYGYAGGKMISKKLLDDYDIRFAGKLNSQEDLSLCLEVYQVAKKVCVLDYSGYCYYYVPSQRTPQYKVYLQNQMSIVHRARENGFMSTDADLRIRNRIELLIYSYLYSVSYDSNECRKAIKSIKEIEGIMDYLKEKVNYSEQGLVGQAARVGLYGCIKRYFNARDCIKRIVKRIM